MRSARSLEPCVGEGAVDVAERLAGRRGGGLLARSSARGRAMASASASMASGVIGTASPEQSPQTSLPRAAEKPRAPPEPQAAQLEHRQVAGLVEELEERAEHEAAVDRRGRRCRGRARSACCAAARHALLGLVLGEVGGGLADDRCRGAVLAVGAQPGEHVHQLRLRYRGRTATCPGAVRGRRR